MRQLQKELANNIKKTKRKYWKNACAELEKNPFGNAYKTIMRQLRKPIPPYNINDDEINRIVRELFVSAEDKEERYERNISQVKPFDTDELETARNKIKTGKAAGPDELTPETVRTAASAMPTLILKMLNRLLETQNFPEKWKRSRVVLIPKGMKGPQSEMTYRPFCLLDTIGKLYEMLVRERLAKELEEKKYLAERQYGFRKRFRQC